MWQWWKLELSLSTYFQVYIWLWLRSSSRSYMQLASSPVFYISFHSTSTCVGVGSQSTSSMAGSSQCLWPWPASLILLDAAFSLRPGCPSYWCLLVTYSLWSMFSTACSILVLHPSRDVCREGFRIRVSQPYTLCHETEHTTKMSHVLWNGDQTERHWGTPIQSRQQHLPSDIVPLFCTVHTTGPSLTPVIKM